MFVDWIQTNLIHHINPYPLPKNVIIMDNWSVHHCQSVIGLINSKGAIIVYLPPYNPYLNLAEYHFNAIKSFMRSSKAKNIDNDRKKMIYGILNCTNKNWEHVLSRDMRLFD